MNSYLLANKMIQYGVSLTLYFILFAWTVEFCIKAFRIQNHRFKATIRFLTLFNIALAPLSLFLPKKWMLINTNIFGCAHPIQKYLFNLFYSKCELYSGAYGVNTLLGKWLLPIPATILTAIILGTVATSLIQLALLAVNYFKARKEFRLIEQNGSISYRPIDNLKLVRNLNKLKVRIIYSDQIQVPFAGFGNRIIFPNHLAETLSQEEYEAIISHELEHLKWRDGLVRLFSQLVASLFWWIPMSNWLHGLEHDQELACDHAIKRYQFDGIDLAQALQKTLHQSLDVPSNCPAFADHLYLSGKDSLLERFQNILHPINCDPHRRKKYLITSLVVIALPCGIGSIIC